MDFLEGSVLPPKCLPTFLDEFEVKDSVISSKGCSDGIIHRLVISKALEKEAIRIAYASTLATHPSTFRTYHRLKEYYKFQNLLSALRNIPTPVSYVKREEEQ